MRALIQKISKKARHLLEIILSKMTERNYQELLQVGKEFISRVEAFDAVVRNKPYGHYGFESVKRLDANSICYDYSTKEFKLDVSVSTQDKWG